MSFLLKIDSASADIAQNGETSDNFTIYFPSGIRLDNPQDWEIGLVKATFINSIYNISALYNNQTFKYTNSTGINRTVIIPAGSYSIEDLNNYLKLVQEENSDYLLGNPLFELKPNYSLLKCYFEINQGLGTTAIDLSVGNLYKLLGFSLAQASVPITASITTGANVANINNNIVSLDIKCSIATGSYDNARSSSVIYNSGIEVSSGETQTITPNNIIYLPLNISDAIYRINMRITDQAGNRIDLNNEPVSYLLSLRKMPHLLNSNGKN